MNNIKINEAVIISCPPDKSPIFFVNLRGKIMNANKKDGLFYSVNKMVVKGTLEQIKKSDYVKRQFLRELFSDENNSKKKARDFDLSRLTITDVEIIRGLGYGIKSE